MASLIDKWNKEMASKGIAFRTAQARSWLQGKIAQTKIPTNRSNILNDPNRIAPQAFVGRMYFFRYDPKYKERLPVYDEFPLVIPMSAEGNGFMGMNLHYLDAGSRLGLLNQLQIFLNNDKYDDSTRFNITYDLLNSMSRFSAVQQCIRRYLYSHILSSIIYIEPNNWETAIFLPTANMVYRK